MDLVHTLMRFGKQSHAHCHRSEDSNPFMALLASRLPAGPSHLGEFFLWSWSVGLRRIELAMSLRATPWGGGPSRDRQIMPNNPQFTLVTGATT